MRISEIKVKKTIHRPTQTFNESGNRIYNEFEYDLPYNPSHRGSERERAYAKFADLIPFFLIFYSAFDKILIVSLFFSIISVLLFGAISEFVFGTTLGKKIFKLKVINDFANNPELIRSLFRNILSFANFFPVLSDFEPGPNEYWRTSGSRFNFSMHLNNQITKTFIVKENKIIEIKKLLEQKK